MQIFIMSRKIEEALLSLLEDKKKDVWHIQGTITRLPFRLGELHHRFRRVISERFRRYGLSFQSRIRIDAVGRQSQIDNLPELIDLVLQVTDRGVALLEDPLKHIDGLVATSQGLRTLVQQSFQVTYGIHSLLSISLFLVAWNPNDTLSSFNITCEPYTTKMSLFRLSMNVLQAQKQREMRVRAKYKYSNISMHSVLGPHHFNLRWWQY